MALIGVVYSQKKVKKNVFFPITSVGDAGLMSSGFASKQTSIVIQ
jgi:hypothetical protein